MKGLLFVLSAIVFMSTNAEVSAQENVVVKNPASAENRDRFVTLVSKIRQGSEAEEVCAKSELGDPSVMHRFIGFELLGDPFDDTEIYSGMVVRTVSTRDTKARATKQQLGSFYQYEKSQTIGSIQPITVSERIPTYSTLQKLWSDVEARHTVISTKLDDDGNGIEKYVSNGFLAKYLPSDCGCKIGICEFTEKRTEPASSETKYIQKQYVENGLWHQSVFQLDVSRKNKFGRKVWETKRSYLESGMPLDLHFKNESTEIVLFRADNAEK